MMLLLLICNHPRNTIMNGRRFFIGGNWKLNGNLSLLKEFSSDSKFIESCALASVEVVLFPAFPYLGTAKEAFAGSAVSVGAQNCHSALSGAFTGEVSVSMLQDLSVDWVILGHSERRSIFGETNAVIADKLSAATRANLRVVLCVGETWKQREAGLAEKIIEEQLLECLGDSGVLEADKLVIAYEPVWAIGTGKVASPLQAQQMHHHIRQFLTLKFNKLKDCRIVYGGSVAVANSAELASQPDIDGFLIGGASLKVKDLTSIITL
jgi:triosephosphate isomerase (TIM)